VTFRDLAVGTYRVRVELEGFSTVEVTGVDVPDGGAPLVRIPLEIAYLAEEIVVSGVPSPPPLSPPPAEMEPVLAAPLPDADLSVEAYGLPDDSGDAAAEPQGPIHVESAEAPVPAPPPPAPRRQVDRGKTRVDATALEQERRRSEAREAEEKQLAEADVEADWDDELAAEDVPEAPVFTDTAADRLSTFGLDVDTGSYTIIRQELADEWLPEAEDVRVEEVVNYLRYPDLFAAEPARPGEVFRMQGDGAPWPFAAAIAPGSTPATYLLRFRVAARPVAAENRKPAVLTLLLDVSGSMEGENLEMVRQGVNRLLDTLEPRDRVALVVFSDDAEVLASHGDRNALRTAVANLATRGSTNAEAGLVLAYQQAEAAFDPAAANRVILLSDGLANMGATTVDELLDRVAAAADSGIELTTACVGRETDDALMERLADRGDGRYVHVDGPEEAERVFVEELTGTLQTVAEEARAQVEMNPRLVHRWRLLGYENRAIADREFRFDDTVDAGEVGAGQSVTALYEVELTPAVALSPDQPLALLRLRYRRPGEDLFREEELWLRGRELAPSWDAAPADLRLAAVAGRFAELLRPAPELSSYLRTAAGLDALVPQARAVADALPGSPRAAELAGLVATAAKVAAEDAAEEAEHAAEEAAQRAAEEKAWRWVEDDDESPPSAPPAPGAESPPSAPPETP
jgi:Ca-activated chloride channel family protein